MPPGRGLVIVVPPQEEESHSRNVVWAENWLDYPVFITIKATGQEVEIPPGGGRVPFIGRELYSVRVRGGKRSRRGLMRFCR